MSGSEGGGWPGTPPAGIFSGGGYPPPHVVGGYAATPLQFLLFSLDHAVLRREFIW